VYFTTPIYYVNDKPHIGHYYTTIVTDVLYRYHILIGDDARMQTGTDEHGQKIEKSAQNRGINAMQFCNEISNEFRKMCEIANCLCIQQDEKNFIRTTEGRDFETGEITDESLKNGRHIKAVLTFWDKLMQNGWIYKGKYSGWYAIRDEAFYAESELINGKGPTGADVEWREEECYFFKLSKMQKILLELYKKNPDMIKPFERYTEVMAFISGVKFVEFEKNEFKEDALMDLCISRPNLKWGIPVPNEKNQTIYVWLDALMNYISALSYPNGENYKKYWLNADKIHIVGKDILRFHCVYWPAFLIAEQIKFDEMNNIEIANLKANLPSKIVAHGWWTNNGEKISKSLGNVINPIDEIEFIESFGVEKSIAVDYFRYFLVRAMSFGNDGDYSRDTLQSIINADLSNNIGNLIQRTLVMMEKYFDLKRDENFTKSFKKDDQISVIKNGYNNYNFLRAIDGILQIAREMNEYIDQKKPWILEKEGKMDELHEVLNIVLVQISVIGYYIQPIMPNIALKIEEIFQNEDKFQFIKNICPRIINT